MLPISLSWRKFANLGESPDFEPIDDLSDLDIITKKDGSTLIVSRHRNDIIIRTRGTVDARTLPNGHEIELLKQKYPKVFAMEDSAWFNPDDYSFLYEWTTPSNRIVLNETAEPTLWLTGVVRHDDYSYVSQSDLDHWARGLEVPRPKRHNMSLHEIQDHLASNTTIEGVVIYANNGQCLKKIKTPRYIYLHRVYTGIKTVNQLIDMWIDDGGQADRDDFEQHLAKKFDWELVVSLKPLMDEMFEMWHHINVKLEHLKTLVVSTQLTRKDVAKLILSEAGTWSGVVFEMLDNKPRHTRKLFELHQKDQKKLLEHHISQTNMNL